MATVEEYIQHELINNNVTTNFIDKDSNLMDIGLNSFELISLFYSTMAEFEVENDMNHVSEEIKFFEL
jgi:hypothetical protein